MNKDLFLAIVAMDSYKNSDMMRIKSIDEDFSID
jgi:hypothetical protein